MATDVVICELLCFLKKNFDKLTVSQLKPTIVSFYRDEELVYAKDILKKAVCNALKESGTDLDLPRLPVRQGDNKCKQTVDDIFKLMTIADEKNLLDMLPRFVAEDLSRVPFVNVDSLSVTAMARKFEVMEQRLLNLETLFDKSVSERLPSTEVCVGVDSVDAGASVSFDYTDNKAVVDNTWKTVSYKKDKSNRIIHVPPEVTGNMARKAQADKPKGKQRVIGTRPTGDGTSLKTGVPIVQKAIVHIDNLGSDCTEALLQDYLLAADINVISCFKAKSWLRDGEKDMVTAFRVCIPAHQHHLIFDSQLWAQGTIIRDWQFRGKQNGRDK